MTVEFICTSTPCITNQSVSHEIIPPCHYLPTFDASWIFYLHLRQHGIDRFHYHRRHLLRPLRPVHLHGDVGVAPPHGLDVRVELPQPHLHLGIVAPLLQPPQHLGQVVCLALLQSVYRLFLNILRH